MVSASQVGRGRAYAPPSDAAFRLAAAVAAFGLPGSSRQLPAEPLPDDEWRAFFAVVEKQRVAALLRHAASVGAFPLTAAQQAEVARNDLFMTSRVMWLERKLVEVYGALEEAGIPVRVLKGPVVARTIYSDPSLRSYVDLDLLVPGVRLDDAVEVLRRFDLDPVRIDPRPGFTGRFAKSVELRGPARLSIDLHRTIAPGAFGFKIPSEDLFGPGTAVTVGGRDVVGLGPTERFVHVCYHATVGNVHFKLAPLRDLAQQALVVGIDEPQVLRLADRWSARVVVAEAVLLTADVLGLASLPLLDWAHGYVPEASELQALRRHAGGSDVESFDGEYALVRAIPGVRMKAIYLASLVFPSRQYLESRGQQRLGRLVAGFRAVTGRGRS